MGFPLLNQSGTNLSVDESSSPQRRPIKICPTPIDESIIDRAVNQDDCESVGRVLVIYRSGHIGMLLEDGVFSSPPHFFIQTLLSTPTYHDHSFLPYDIDQPMDDSQPHPVLALPLCRTTGRRVIYRVLQYQPPLHSSNIEMSDWVEIASDIESQYHNYDGFIVLHGTDTLTYTAAALAFMLENLGKPVILTGSQLPIGRFRSDGWNNLLGALLIAGGLVLCSYGKGNVPINDDLLKIIEEANKRGVLMINVTQFTHGDTRTRDRIIYKFGVIPGHDITTEAALAKLVYVLNKSEDGIGPSRRDMLMDSLRGEVTLPGTSNHYLPDWMSSTASTPNSTQPSSLLGGISSLFNSSSGTLHQLQLAECLGALLVTTTQDSDSSKQLTAQLACSAASVDDIGRLQELLDVVGHLNLTDSDGQTPLHKAAYHGHLNACRFLLDLKDGQVEVEATSNSHRPLDSAIGGLHPSLDLVNLFVKNGSATLTSNRSVLIKSINQAAAFGDLRRLQLYRMAGASFQELDAEGRAPIHVAVANNQLTTVRFLVQPHHPLDDSPKSAVESTKSATAVAVDDEAGGVDPNQLTAWGTTPLEEARLRKFGALCRFLESLPASPIIRTNGH